MSTPELKSVKVAGFGDWAPDNIVTNQQITEDLKRQGLESFTDEAVQSHTGIRERRISDPKISTSDMAILAAKPALDDAEIEPNEVDCIIVATTTPDYPVSGTAPIVKEKLKIKHAAAFDLNAGCAGFVTGVSIGASLIKAGEYQNVLVIGADKLSVVTNRQDRFTRYLFADGAGATVLSASDEHLTPIHSYLDADGKDPSLLYAPGGGSRDPLTVEKTLFLLTLAQEAALEQDPDKKLEKENLAREAAMKLAQNQTIHMQGHEIFEKAVDSMLYSIDKVLERSGMTTDQIDWLIPHQANLVIINSLISIVGFDLDRVIINVQKYGNTSSASIPIAIAGAIRDGRFKRGNKFLLTAFGAGLNSGAVIGTYKEAA